MPAAVAAEAARCQGKFWAMHDLLYKGSNTPLSIITIERAAASLPLDQPRFRKDSRAIAQRIVKNDMEEADALGVQGTPSFVLCCPDGKVVLLKQLNQLEAFLSH